MGYEVQETIYKLHFEGHDGLEVKTRAVAMGVLLSLADQLSAVRGGGMDSFAEVKELVNWFTDSLHSWNLTRGGAPIPCTREEFLALDMPFAMDIFGAWAEVMSGRVPDPLEQKSTGGSQSVERSIKMETL